MDMILSTLCIIFVTLYFIFHLKFKPNMDYVNGKYIMWYSIKGKGSNEEYRDYIELF